MQDARGSLKKGEESLQGEFDRDQIEKVVMNLVYNAVKFTPEGGSIEVRARRVEEKEA
ncbi:MAG: hypothetical protein HYS07_08385 [Chlamydiae bacterium]|nr:hypothetical protein [Chlamydiota bacterium]